MSGLEKIIEQIKSEADASAAQIIKEANEQAAEILKESGETQTQIQKESEEKCAAAREDILRRSRSAAHMQQRQQILQAKQEIIDEMILEAKTSLYGLDRDAYFAIIRQMLEAHVQDEPGQIRFCKKDLDRLPDGFAGEIEAAAETMGGSLTLDETPAAIDGGFVLIYGGIEENCSFSRAFAEARERIQDQLREFLFT